MKAIVKQPLKHVFLGNVLNVGDELEVNPEKRFGMYTIVKPAELRDMYVPMEFLEVEEASSHE